MVRRPLALVMGSGGYVLISDFFRMCHFQGIFRSYVDMCVHMNPKQRSRSEIGSDGQSHIRAQQGHAGQLAVDEASF